MEEHGMKLGLLDFLSFRAGCMYLSELHRPENRQLVQNAVLRLEPDLFTLGEWNDAVRYITGKDVNFPTCEEAMQYILMDEQERKAVQ